jgi:hypothetical protein
MSLEQVLFDNLQTGPWEKSGIIEYRVAKKGPATILLFRCTDDSVTKWKNNLDFPPVVYKNSPQKWRAHGGFVRAWKESQDEIMSQVYGCELLYIAGYSRGAVFAMLAHEDYEWQTKQPATTYTFGGPRFLWMSPHVANRFANVRRFVNRGDFVAELPPSIFGFHHAGQCIRIGRGFWPDAKKHEPASYRAELHG